MAQKQKQAPSPLKWHKSEVFFFLLSSTKQFAGTVLMRLLCRADAEAQTSSSVFCSLHCTLVFFKSPGFNCKLVCTHEITEPLTVQFLWVLPSHRNYLSNTSESLDHIKSSLIITNSSLYSCQDNRVNIIINRNCFYKTGNHSWSFTPMLTLSKICKYMNAKENSKWSLMPF